MMPSSPPSTVSPHRCPNCRMLAQLCLCSDIPLLNINTKITILMHALEEHKTTSTAHLLRLALPQTQIALFGKVGKEEEFEVPANVTPLILFPDASAPILNPEFYTKLKRPVLLIVPDGSWSQARKLIHKRKNLHSIQRVRIERQEPSRYLLRQTQHRAGLCTLEAVAEALAILEGPKIKQELEALLSLMVSRVMRSRSYMRTLSF